MMGTSEFEAEDVERLRQGLEAFSAPQCRLSRDLAPPNSRPARFKGSVRGRDTKYRQEEARVWQEMSFRSH
jgi:hypothetical protein